MRIPVDSATKLATFVRPRRAYQCTRVPFVFASSMRALLSRALSVALDITAPFCTATGPFSGARMAAASTQATTVATADMILDIVDRRKTFGENVDGCGK